METKEPAASPLSSAGSMHSLRAALDGLMCEHQAQQQQRDTQMRSNPGRSNDTDSPEESTPVCCSRKKRVCCRRRRRAVWDPSRAANRQATLDERLTHHLTKITAVTRDIFAPLCNEEEDDDLPDPVSFDRPPTGTSSASSRVADEAERLINDNRWLPALVNSLLSASFYEMCNRRLLYTALLRLVRELLTWSRATLPLPSPHQGEHSQRCNCGGREGERGLLDILREPHLASRPGHPLVNALSGLREQAKVYLSGIDVTANRRSKAVGDHHHTTTMDLASLPPVGQRTPEASASASASASGSADLGHKTGKEEWAKGRDAFVAVSVPPHDDSEVTECRALASLVMSICHDLLPPAVPAPPSRFIFDMSFMSFTPHRHTHTNSHSHSNMYHHSNTDRTPSTSGASATSGSTSTRSSSPRVVVWGGEAAESEADKYCRIMQQFQVGSASLLSCHAYRNEVRKEAASGTPIHSARHARLLKEMAGLSTLLPLNPSSSIFVRFDESNISLWRALITGPEGTPYDSGGFVFDIYCPPSYPSMPPKVTLITTGNYQVSFNPNLYVSGRVCLSLLNTWAGRDEETWDPVASTILQVLVSIQALIFVPDPWFNEPGLAVFKRWAFAQKRSLRYTMSIREYTVGWAIRWHMRTAPHTEFADALNHHFALRSQHILDTIRRWIAEAADFDNTCSTNSNGTTHKRATKAASSTTGSNKHRSALPEEPQQHETDGVRGASPTGLCRHGSGPSGSLSAAAAGCASPHSGGRVGGDGDAVDCDGGGRDRHHDHDESYLVSTLPLLEEGLQQLVKDLRLR
ncbi:unnamed protein product [Vitrella brassicaformis CCMP3155]|uniref:UBC core domain-containing protein n=3 Tax=Vitrella brassicaformis TaxID=1169539 RepID=A0A0G4G4V1_VITBC|nr:unnamed protein product [Vitrella brassicaformis CCMP3155]|eukprot:CEM23129.1 unnamed protein product [Vitrella brassicaformis CCMP3155]